MNRCLIKALAQTTKRTGKVIEMERPGVQKQGIMRQLKLKNASISVNSDQMGKGVYFFPLQYLWEVGMIEILSMKISYI